MSDLYIEARLQAIMEIADSACSDSKDIENINGFCTEIGDFLNKQDVPDTNVGDLIGRKKLIEDIETLKNQIHILTKNIRGLVPTKCDNVSAINEKCNNIMTEIYAFQIGYNQPQVQQWIPCSERLPECEIGCETEAVMYQMKNTGTIEIGYFGIGGKFRDKYFRHLRNTTDGVDASSVIAWQQLPQPYTESEDK